MADMTPITYSANAHTAELAQRLHDVESEHSRRFRMSAASGQRLPHRHPTVDLFPMRELQDMKPAKLREIENMPEHTPRPKDRPEHPLRWDEECLRYTSQTKINFILGVIRMLGITGCVFFVPIALLVTLYTAFEYAGYTSEGVSFGTVYENFYWGFLAVFTLVFFQCGALLL